MSVLQLTSGAPLSISAVRSWLFNQALPFWATAGLDDAHGGFLEEVGADSAPTDCSFKRTRVTCRQIYVFSHAAILGWAQGDALAKWGCDYLEAKINLGPERGWARRLSREGAVIDPTPDLYDISFVLLAYAWRYRATGDVGALERTHEVLDFVQRRMRQVEGFDHILPMAGRRLQNPHMHLLEACLDAFEATAHRRFIDQAAELIILFRTRLFDGRTLAEAFTDDWRRAPGEEGQIVEPGHMFEWAWILARYGKLAGGAEALTLADEVRALVTFAETYGVGTSGAVRNACYDDGSVRDGASRLWPNTERIKGHLALFEIAGDDPRPAIASALEVLGGRFFLSDPKGAWIDRCDVAGRPIPGPSPASTFYHVFLAFAEILRLEPRLSSLN